MDDDPRSEDATAREQTFEAAVANLEASAPVPVLRRLIDRRGVIARLRARHVSWQEIATVLAGVGIRIGPGGLRNYASRIHLAVQDLEAAGEDTPDGDRIYAICRARARPARATSHPPARRSPAVPKPDGRPASSSSTHLMRDPKQEL
ncbi:hypothetical protein [Rhodobaculum claviforme]|uniref:Uncharacterized protein n=1 Tax=Rhodobaculum claviforme TaxID=1549854 RepID=A0A934WIR9_9RHOB|nr:hypothetical protein [Rhodobaculum claviforme]MBK5927152.1 hypothetical protein [Rhodobaculum claviforme]